MLNIVLTMGLPAYKTVDYGAERSEVTTDKLPEDLKYASQLILAIDLSRKHIFKAFTETSPPVKYISLFWIINVLQRVKHSHQSRIEYYTGLNARTIAAALKWLMLNEYIKSYDQVRLIRALGCHQRIKCYCLRPKGRKTLRACLTIISGFVD